MIDRAEADRLIPDLGVCPLVGLLKSVPGLLFSPGVPGLDLSGLLSSSSSTKVVLFSDLGVAGVFGGLKAGEGDLADSDRCLPLSNPTTPGDFNSGDLPPGDLNSGDLPPGDFNSGDFPPGDFNSGDAPPPGEGRSRVLPIDFTDLEDNALGGLDLSFTSSPPPSSSILEASLNLDVDLSSSGAGVGALDEAGLGLALISFLIGVPLGSGVGDLLIAGETGSDSLSELWDLLSLSLSITTSSSSSSSGRPV